MITEGHLARHVRRMRRLYERRRERLLGGLRRDFDRWLEPVNSAAGLHLTAWLRGDGDADQLVTRARARDVGLQSLSSYYLGPRGRPGLIFGYGATTESEVSAGLERLRALWRP